jgi:hypothetical protein
MDGKKSSVGNNLATPLPIDKEKVFLPKESPFANFFNKMKQYPIQSLSLKDFNPLDNTRVSVPALVLSFCFLRYYRHRYFLLTSNTMKAISLTFNYFFYYYLIHNGLECNKFVSQKQEQTI